jgi:hypothetical protein
MPINSPDIFDSVGDAVVSGGGAGVSTFVALNDTPANYTGSAGKLVAVNSTPDALEFIDNVNFFYAGMFDATGSTTLIPIVNGATNTQTSSYVNTILIPTDIELISMSIITNADAGDIVLGILKLDASKFGDTTSAITPEFSTTIASSLQDTLYTIAITGAITYSAGEMLCVRYDPVTAGSYIIFNIKYKFI